MNTAEQTLQRLERAQAAVVKATELRDELVLRASMQGASARRIAARIGVTHPTVRAIIQRGQPGSSTTA